MPQNVSMRLHSGRHGEVRVSVRLLVTQEYRSERIHFEAMENTENKRRPKSRYRGVMCHVGI